jgi:uncharacterized protein CbrC (UPF0167 family)
MLPTFRYHPDPVATRSVARSDTTCLCCGEARGYIYTAPVYGPSRLHEKLCPWCIASGAAASKYNCFFSDDSPLTEAGLDRSIVLEVSRKTPGYSSWQQGEWQVCCDDACEFQGDATKRHLADLSEDRLAWHLRRWKWAERDWQRLVEAYKPGGATSLLRFVCRHCGQPTLAIDPA